MRILTQDLPTGIPSVHAINYQKIKTKSTNVNLDDENLFEIMQKTAFKMVKTCLMDGGIGLAAPQIGTFKRMFVIQDKDEKEIFDLYINPTWKPKDQQKCALEEGCLSVPNKQYKISRFKSIEVNYWCFDPNNSLVNIQQDLNDYAARVFQHEFGHLDGTSIVDVYKRQTNQK